MMAVAQSRRIMAYEMLQRQAPYREAGGDFCEQRQPEHTARRLVKRLEHLGYCVTLQRPSINSLP
jgi:hypothetical protein